MFVQTFVAESAIERFDIRVLIRLAGFDEPQRDPSLVDSLDTHQVAADNRWVSMLLMPNGSIYDPTPK